VAGFDEDAAYLKAIAATGLVADLWFQPGQKALSATVDQLAQLLHCDTRQVFDLASVLGEQAAEVARLFQVDVTDLPSATELIEQLETNVA
jgi:hypothetical protein